jgi:hypothetical protein
MGSHRRKLIWATSLSSNVALAAATGITPVDLLAGLEVGGVGTVGGTVVRTHVLLSISDPAADTNPGVFWGVMVWPKTRVGVNVPPVNADYYLDWMMLRVLTPGTASTTWQDPTFANYLFGEEYDLKSRRKLPEMDDTLIFSLYNSGTSAIKYTAFVRTLVALP